MMTTKKLVLQFLKYFILSCFFYYLFSVVQVIIHFMAEAGVLINIINTCLFSLSLVDTIMLFGLFISALLFTAYWLRNKRSVIKLLKLGLVMSVLFSALIFITKNTLVPELKIMSYLSRYEYALRVKLNTEERREMSDDLRKNRLSMMNVLAINKYKDSLQTEISAKETTIKELALSTPDSILESVLPNSYLNKYIQNKPKNTSEFGLFTLNKLKYEVSLHKQLIKQIKLSNWEEAKYYLTIFLTFFFVAYGIVLGFNLKNKHPIVAVIAGIAIYLYSYKVIEMIGNNINGSYNSTEIITNICVIVILFLGLTYRMVLLEKKQKNNRTLEH
ncbi:hypothetical protein M4I21_05265 [Cellulophaga sp. 20_2_10]|uniref:hypothetical protein n=1 Tax=Cellulophaga sp. 20_2_10 TaxID=2942476 RepID=UPI00201A4745|nr:hypothetical protein [Cellulophaga sp. 20_2_10]MCL5245208.1 hypothetical protein [Cellulophaga sp. 20_2_10]